MANYRLKTFEVIDVQKLVEVLKWIGYLHNLWSLFKALRGGWRYISRLIETVRSYAVARVYLAQIIGDSLFYEASRSEEEKMQRKNSLSETLKMIGEPDLIKDEKFLNEIAKMKTTASIFGPRWNSSSNRMEFVKQGQFDTFTPAMGRAVRLLESTANDLKSLSRRNPATFLKLAYEYQFRQNLLHNMLQSVSAKGKNSGKRVQPFRNI